MALMAIILQLANCKDMIFTATLMWIRFPRQCFGLKNLGKKVWKKNAIEGCAMHSVHFHETERGSKLLGSTNSHLI